MVFSYLLVLTHNSLFGILCGTWRVQQDARFDWSVEHVKSNLQMLYLLYVIAANWWTPMLVTGLTCLIVYFSSVLVSGCFYFCSFLYSLSSCFAGPGNIFITATAMNLGWQMAKASLLFPCCCTGQAGSLDWNQVRGTVTFGWVHVEACTPWSICDHR